MKQEIKSVLKKTAKIAGVTCLAVGSVAVLTSGTALKAINEGGKYLASAVKRIIKENDMNIESDMVSEADFVAETTVPGQERILSETIKNI